VMQMTCHILDQYVTAQVKLGQYPTLGVSSSTIESHRSHIMDGMDFASFSDVIRYAIRNHPLEA